MMYNLSFEDVENKAIETDIKLDKQPLTDVKLKI
jgi:hypothetical protein